MHKNLINEQLKNNIEEINKKRLKYEQKEKEHIENLLNKRKELKKINEMKKERMSLSMRRNKIIILIIKVRIKMKKKIIIIIKYNQMLVVVISVVQKNQKKIQI